MTFFGASFFFSLCVENYFGNLSILDGSAVIVASSVGELECDFPAGGILNHDFPAALGAVVRVQALKSGKTDI